MWCRRRTSRRCSRWAPIHRRPTRVVHVSLTAPEPTPSAGATSAVSADGAAGRPIGDAWTITLAGPMPTALRAATRNEYRVRGVSASMVIAVVVDTPSVDRGPRGAVGGLLDDVVGDRRAVARRSAPRQLHLARADAGGRRHRRGQVARSLRRPPRRGGDDGRRADPDRVLRGDPELVRSCRW